MKPLYKILLILVLFSGACKKDKNSPEKENKDLTQEELMDKIENQFTFTPNQNFEALYYCLRKNSSLEWYFLFYENGSLDVLFTTDTYDDYSFRGSYTYTNDEINIQMPAGANMPFPNGLDETSILIMQQFGLVAAFATEEMVGICIGHNLNTQDPPKVNANYDCPIINVQAASDEDNAIELVHRAVPFEFPVTGSIFRQQDTYVNGLTNPITRRGYGIYRQIGDEFYATFQISEDFAKFSKNKLPYDLGTINVPFDDYNILSGKISADGQELTVDQLSPEEGACQLR